MSHYKSNVRDIEFNLFEVFGADKRMGTGPFAEMDPDTAKEILREVNKLASGPLSETLLSSDRNPPKYDPATYTVTMPEDFKASYQTLMDAGYWSLELPEHLGGQGAPPACAGPWRNCCWARTRPRSCTWQAPASPPSWTPSATRTRRRWPSG